MKNLSLIFLLTITFISCKKNNAVEQTNKNTLENTTWTWIYQKDYEDNIFIQPKEKMTINKKKCLERTTYIFEESKFIHRKYEWSDTNGCNPTDTEGTYSFDGEILTIKNKNEELTYKVGITTNGYQERLTIVKEESVNGVTHKEETAYVKQTQ